MIKVENPSRMNFDEADKAFAPNSYVMIICMRTDSILTGLVTAYAPLGEKDSLIAYADELVALGKYGEIPMKKKILT